VADIAAATDTGQDMAIADIEVEAAADTTATAAAGTDTTVQAVTAVVRVTTAAVRTMAAVATAAALGQGPDLGIVAEAAADPANITAADQARGAAPVPLPRLPKAVPAALARKHGVGRLTPGIRHDSMAESRLAFS
jgi:hypothetical protein